MVTLASSWTAGTVYLFREHSAVNFAAWCGLCATMTAAYHFLNVRDSKEPDRV